MARGSFHLCHRRTRTRSAVDTLLNKRSQILDRKTQQIPSFLPLTHGVADGFARRRIFASIDRASHKSRHLRCQCNCNLLDRRHRSSLLLVTSTVCYWRTGSKRPVGRARGQLLDFPSASAFRPGWPAVRISSRRKRVFALRNIPNMTMAPIARHRPHDEFSASRSELLPQGKTLSYYLRTPRRPPDG